jgi:hypothetical protein
MSVSSASEKKQKSLGEIIIITLLLAVLMTNLVSGFLDQTDYISDAGFARLSTNFFSKVTLVHSKWVIDDKPRWVSLSSTSDLEGQNNRSAEYIPVNINGWIDVGGGQLDCYAIWEYALGIPMEFMKKPIIVIEIINNRPDAIGGGEHICRYSMQSGMSFDYIPDKGEVKLNTAKASFN